MLLRWYITEQNVLIYHEIRSPPVVISNYDAAFSLIDRFNAKTHQSHNDILSVIDPFLYKNRKNIYVVNIRNSLDLF